MSVEINLDRAHTAQTVHLKIRRWVGAVETDDRVAASIAQELTDLWATLPPDIATTLTGRFEGDELEALRRKIAAQLTQAKPPVFGLGSAGWRDLPGTRNWRRPHLDLDANTSTDHAHRLLDLLDFLRCYLGQSGHVMVQLQEAGAA